MSRPGDSGERMRIKDRSRDGKVYLFDHAPSAWKFIQNLYWLDCVVVENVNPSNFRLFEGLADYQMHVVREKRLVISHYDVNTRVLVLALPGNAPRFLDFCMLTSEALATVGLGSEVEYESGTGYRVLELNGGEAVRSRGEAFVHMRPKNPQSNLEDAGDWPTVAIEASRDCPYELMKKKGEWWLRESRGAVKMVLLVKFDKEAGKILIDLMSEFPVPPQHKRARCAGFGFIWTEKIDICLSNESTGDSSTGSNDDVCGDSTGDISTNSTTIDSSTHSSHTTPARAPLTATAAAPQTATATAPATVTLITSTMTKPETY